MCCDWCHVFGDDAADYFNQLAIASEDWWLLGCAFITTDDIFGTKPLQIGDYVGDDGILYTR